MGFSLGARRFTIVGWAGVVTVGGPLGRVFNFGEKQFGMFDCVEVCGGVQHCCHGDLLKVIALCRFYEVCGWWCSGGVQHCCHGDLLNEIRVIAFYEV